MKRCPRCGDEKPRESFYKKLNGLSSYCKECTKNWYLDYRDTDHGKRVRNLRSKREYQERKRHHSARHKVAHEIRMGRLMRPERCESCKTVTTKLEAHHSDYDKPLDVNWLCVGCHLAVHNRLISTELVGK